MESPASAPLRNKESLLARAQPLLTPAVLDTVAALALDRGVEKNDLTELLLASGLQQELTASSGGSILSLLDPNLSRLLRDGELSRFVLDGLAAGLYVAVPRIDRQGQRTYAEGLAESVPKVQIDSANVVAFRMAHRQEVAADLTPEAGGYARPGLGMDLSMTAEQIWERSRGYWRIRADADYILPTRLGYAPYLFKVADWRTASDATRPSDKTARYWAQNGWLVDADQRRLVPVGGSGEREASDLDLELAALFTARIVRYPLGIRNPAVWIGRRAG